MEKTIRLMIVEDEPIIALDLQMLLEAKGYEVYTTDNFDSAIALIQEKSPHLAMLDIEISGSKDGVELAEWMQEHTSVPYLFLTSYRDHSTIKRVQKLHPSAYLVKPFDESNVLANIELALYKARESVKVMNPAAKSTEKVFVKNGAEVKGLSLNEITYVEAYDNYSYVHTETQKYLLTNTLKSAEEKLSPHGFLRIHKSYLVQVNKIESLQEGYVFVASQALPLGKSYRAGLMQVLTFL